MTDSKDVLSGTAADQQVSEQGCPETTKMAGVRGIPYSLFPIPCLIVFLASIPYIFGLLFHPKNTVFTGFTFNIDDACVYTSWIRQVADGHFLIQNMFTSQHQTALQFNIFFVILGLVARVTHLSPAAVFHIARIVLGIALLLLVRRFSMRFLKTNLERALIVPVVGLSGGLCWLISGIGNHQGPVDFWQPESITFLSIYLNPLFLAGLILMISSLHFLFRMKETGSWRDTLLAGLMLLLLANVHTYDIVTVGAVWAVYLIAEMIRSRRIPWKLVGQSAVAATVAIPALAYQIYLFNNEPAFKMRVESAAPSPALWAYLAGYGLVLILAAFGAWTALKERRSALMLVLWSLIGFALPYLPVAQQRKLIMGLHIPLAILATIAIAHIATRAGDKNIKAVAFLLILILVPSNLLLTQDRTRMAEDIKFLKEGTTAPHASPYLETSRLDALRWLSKHTNHEDVVLAFPETALFIPPIAGNRVYFGHWSETPDYNEKVAEWGLFINAATPEAWRKAFIEHCGAKYIVYPTSIVTRPDEDIVLFDISQWSYVKQVFQSGTTAVYQVIEPLDR